MKIFKEDFVIPKIRLGFKGRSAWTKFQIGLDCYMIFWWTVLGIAHWTTGYKIQSADIALLFASTIWLWIWLLIEDLKKRR